MVSANSGGSYSTKKDNDLDETIKILGKYFTICSLVDTWDKSKILL